MAQLVQRPPGRLVEQVGGTHVGQAGAAADRVQVAGRDGAGLCPVGQEKRSDRPAGDKDGHQSGRAGNRYVAPIAIRDLEVVVPLGTEPAAVTCLVGGRPCAWSAIEGRLSIRVPKLGLFEALRIEHG